MRVLTYNIHGWRGRDDQIDVARLARIIESSQADVVGLNEVFHPLVPPGEQQPALETLAADLGMSYAFAVSLSPRFAFAPLSAYGNALLSRYPLLAHASHHLIPVEGHEQRGLLEARVLLVDGRTPFSVYVTHLDHRSEQVRLKQLAAVFQWTGRDRSLPHLLIGDFNAVSPEDDRNQTALGERLRSDPATAHLVEDGYQVVSRLQKRGYVDVATLFGQPGEPTFPAGNPRARIDYIWASASLASAARDCQVWQTAETTLASDHLPVLAEIDL
jgi:endonuclease/exonuclease/phosphatase family metal-dependent hydrolase